MVLQYPIKVVLVGKSLKITVPLEICQFLKLQKGDTVYVTANNNHEIVAKKAK